MRRKSPSVTKTQYIDRFVVKARRLFKDLSYDEAEEKAFKYWIDHRDTNFKYLETPDKDAECDWLWATHKIDT